LRERRKRPPKAQGIKTSHILEIKMKELEKERKV